MSKSKNPAAFPVVDGAEDMPGMTLRDYFAAQALVGFCTHLGMAIEAANVGDIADVMYDIADAMLVAREEVNE